MVLNPSEPVAATEAPPNPPSAEVVPTASLLPQSSGHSDSAAAAHEQGAAAAGGLPAHRAVPRAVRPGSLQAKAISRDEGCAFNVPARVLSDKDRTILLLAQHGMPAKWIALVMQVANSGPTISTPVRNASRALRASVRQVGENGEDPQAADVPYLRELDRFITVVVEREERREREIRSRMAGEGRS
ncbi:hypothetical protein FGG08_006411 [Glutinoglossum americanum]|uniref:Uncharacterized protein n=1 Tax=Glutinoglossum americanum TaxID=1670608 RepID=A0A9P8I5B4_9PEZI|nr:hypothetical protein FGG08_006411 [Glutinoglossum americanum]